MIPYTPTYTNEPELFPHGIALSGGATAEFLARVLSLEGDNESDSHPSIHRLFKSITENLYTLGSCGFLSGVSGVAWAIASANDHPLFAKCSTELVSELDNLLYRVAVSRHVDGLNPDRTLIGCMLYFLCRIQSGSNQSPYQLIAHKEALILMANDLQRCLVDSNLLNRPWKTLSMSQQKSLLSLLIISSVLYQTSLNPKLSLRMLFSLKFALMPDINYLVECPSHPFDRLWRYAVYQIGVATNDLSLTYEVNLWWEVQCAHDSTLSAVVNSSEIFRYLATFSTPKALRNLLPMLPDPRIALFLLINS